MIERASVKREPWTETGDCAKHGHYSVLRYSPPGHLWGCDACLSERQARESAAADEAKAKADEQDKLLDSGLIGRFRSATFGNFIASSAAQKRVLETCCDFAAGPFDQWRTLWLLGTPGCGKTHLLSAIARATIVRGRYAKVLTARELVSTIRATWRTGAERSEEAVIHELAAVPFLGIDELGLGFGTDAEVLHLNDVIDRRYRSERPTAIASNLDTKALRAVLGDRIMDRLAENAIVRTLTWPSHRRNGEAS